MLISKNRQFIFVHIYKNAGTSITDALRPFALSQWQQIANWSLKKCNLSAKFTPQPFPDHITASDLSESMGPKTFASYFSFAIVRNPWDWQVSLYKFMLKTPAHYQHQIIAKFKNFDEYVNWRCEKEVRFQKDFIYSKDGDLLVDFVGRFENIDNDFKKICSHIGVDTSLPKYNVSNTKPYREYYSDRTRELIAKAFHVDISLFGYEF